ncbi:hypothetical protein ACVOMV_15710 [Mesorhizobium atlanticum]
MVGITLSPEQIEPLRRRSGNGWNMRSRIRSDWVRQRNQLRPTHRIWLPAAHGKQWRSMPSIRSMLPVVNVFFELGREGTMIGD